ncbi:MAG: glycoside hydrolase family 16 protein [Pedobacter sp.]|nr:glycoside hydrolase family 16 protein [Pedobacter sp.]
MNIKPYKQPALSFLVVYATIFIFTNWVPATTKVSETPPEKVIFFDDFSGKQLDRKKWNVEVTGMHFNNELQAYVDSATTIFIAHGEAAEGAANGALVLQPHISEGYKTKDGQRFDFISGRINTMDKFEFTYGSAEAKIKMTAGAGLWPAWWMLGGGAWPTTGEIDIMEYVGERDWASAAVHGPGYSGETPFVNRKYFNNNNDITKWHNYRVDWTPDCLLFKYDGVLMFRVDKAMVEHYGKWCFNTKQHLILNYALGGAYPVKLNGVKSPYYGLPASTVELIKNNKSKMLIDWIKVTKNAEQD